MKVLGLGTSAIDIVLQCDKLPEKDGFSFINKEQVLPGGSCANVLVALSKLNIDTGLVSKIGDDFYSNIFIRDLEKNNVSSKHMKIDKGGSILHTYITVAKNGEKCIFANFGESLLSLSIDEVSEDMLKGIRVFYTDMFPGKPALKLAHLCKKNGVKVVFNLQCGLELMKLCQVSKEDIEEMIQLSDLFLGCSEGLFQISGCNNHKETAKILYKKYKPSLGVIVTCGSKGAIWFDDKELLIHPSFKVNAIDSTGAGDAFIGGIIYSYFMKNESKIDSLKFACGCAAIKCTQLGGRLDTNLSNVLNFIKNTEINKL